MAQLPLDQGIVRFKENEDRFDQFVNDPEGYTSSGGVAVESVREFLARMESTLASYGTLIGKATLADLNADLAYNAGTMGFVSNDPTTANNGYYLKSGASGSGSWTKSTYDLVTVLQAQTAEALRYSYGNASGDQYPNLYDDPDHRNTKAYWPTTSGWELATRNGKRCVRFLPNLGTYSRLFYLSEFGGASALSASLRVEYKPSGTTGGRVLLLQYSEPVISGTYEVARSTYTLPNSEWAAPQTITFDNVTLHPSAKVAVLFIETASGKELYVSEFNVSAGPSAGFRNRSAGRLINLYPEPTFAPVSSLPSPVTEGTGSDRALVMTSEVQEVYEVVLKCGETFPAQSVIRFSGESFASASGTAEMAVVFFNSAGTEISRITSQVPGTTLNTWVPLTVGGEVPTNSDTMKVWCVKRTAVAGTQTAKFRKLVLTSSSRIQSSVPGDYWPGQVRAVRADVTTLQSQINQLLGQREAVDSFLYPNLYTDPYFFEGVSGGLKEVIGNRQTMKFTTVNGSALIPRHRIPGSTFSAGFTIAKSESGTGVRVLIMQLDRNGSQLGTTSPARLTRNISNSGIPSTAPEYVVFSNVELLSDCAHVQFYYDPGTSGGLWIAEPWVRFGNQTKFSHPPAKLANYWTDPEWLGVRMSTSAADQGGTGEYGYGPDQPKDLKFVIEAATLVRRYYLPAQGILAPRSKMFLSFELTADQLNAAEVGVLYQDSNYAEISRVVVKNSQTDLARWERKHIQIVVPDNCSYVQVRFVAWTGLSATRAFFRSITLCDYPVQFPDQVFNLADPLLSAAASGSGSSSKTVWMSTDGSDSATGDYASPVRSFGQARALAGSSGTVMMKAGVYGSEGIISAASNGTDLSVYGEAMGSVIIRLGYKVPGPFTLVAGKSKTWSSPCAQAPSKFVFEHGTPEGSIDSSERHPLHKGRTHRLPSFRLFPVNSVDAVEAATRPSWYYDSATATLYLSTATGDSPNDHEYYIPSGTAITGGAVGRSIRVHNVEVHYGVANFSKFEFYEAQDIRVIGSPSNGIVRDSTRGVERRCQTGGSANDGTNMHNPIPATAVPPSASIPPESTILAFDPYSHDNWDDGDSCHERCNGTYYGGLWEYNGDRGVATAYGAHVTVIGGHSRKNGQIDTSGGEGFGVVGSVAAGEGGVGTQMVCVSCISEGDLHGFAAHASDAILEAFDCRTINCAKAYSTNHVNAIIKLRDCRDSGSAVVKNGPGQFLISNGNLVT